MSIFLKLTAVGVISALILVPSLMLSSKPSDESTAASFVAANERASISTVNNHEEEQPVIKIASLSLGADNSLREPLSYANLPKTETSDRLAQAHDMATQQKFDEAIAILDNVRPSERNDYAVKFLQARILSWSGKHQAAEQEFIALRKQYPDNPDILVSYGYLQFYQNKYRNAEYLFTEVLERHPEYQDAQSGLDRLRALNIK